MSSYPIYCSNIFTITVSKSRVHFNLACHSLVATALFHLKSKHKLLSNNIKPLFLIKNIKIESDFYSYKHLLSGMNTVELNIQKTYRNLYLTKKLSTQELRKGNNNRILPKLCR